MSFRPLSGYSISNLSAVLSVQVVMLIHVFVPSRGTRFLIRNTQFIITGRDNSFRPLSGYSISNIKQWRIYNMKVNMVFVPSRGTRFLINSYINK